MRAQIIVLGPIERQLRVRLPRELSPNAVHRAEQMLWSIGGCGVDLAERLSRLGLSTAVAARIGGEPHDRQIVSSLRGRGILTGSIRADGTPPPVSLLIETPGHWTRVEPVARPMPPSLEEMKAALRQARHLHVCGASLVESRQARLALEILNEAKANGLSTSIEWNEAAASKRASEDRELLKVTDALFTSAPALRSLMEERRLGRAASSASEHGVGLVAATLGAGGCRVYGAVGAVRVPSLTTEPSAGAGFVSGGLLGWLLGATPAICGLLANASSAFGGEHRPPDRRELHARLGRARRDPSFRKLVDAVMEGQSLLERSRRLPRRKKNPPQRH